MSEIRGSTMLMTMHRLGAFLVPVTAIRFLRDLETRRRARSHTPCVPLASPMLFLKFRIEKRLLGRYLASVATEKKGPHES